MRKHLIKGWFWQMFPCNENQNEGSPGTKTGTRGYIRMFPWTESRNEGTFACSPDRKPERNVPKPPFYETALLNDLPVTNSLL